jgi:hypothetical protein
MITPSKVSTALMLDWPIILLNLKRVQALIRRHANVDGLVQNPGPATGFVEGMFSIEPCNPA